MCLGGKKPVPQVPQGIGRFQQGNYVTKMIIAKLINPLCQGKEKSRYFDIDCYC